MLFYFDNIMQLPGMEGALGCWLVRPSIERQSHFAKPVSGSKKSQVQTENTKSPLSPKVTAQTI